MTDNWQLVILVKAPRPGTVKTRLAATIGSDGATRAYREMVERLLNKLGKISNVQLRFAPADGLSAIQPWCRPTWTLAPQCGGNLGQKLSDTIQASVNDGFKRTIVIGSDCPYIAETDILEAVQLLDEYDVVLGPATDGGYWLIGMNDSHTGLFTNINWSTEAVLSQTQERAKSLGLRYREIRTLSDIDTFEDLENYERFRSENPD